MTTLCLFWVSTAHMEQRLQVHTNDLIQIVVLHLQTFGTTFHVLQETESLSHLRIQYEQTPQQDVADKQNITAMVEDNPCVSIPIQFRILNTRTWSSKICYFRTMCNMFNICSQNIYQSRLWKQLKNLFQEQHEKFAKYPLLNSISNSVSLYNFVRYFVSTESIMLCVLS